LNYRASQINPSSNHVTILRCELNDRYVLKAQRHNW